MEENDTIQLLRECNAGIQMGIESIDPLLDKVENREFYDLLKECQRAHEKLNDKIEKLLDEFNDDGKELSGFVRTMSVLKSNMKMALEPGDATIADMMTDGCNMGIKSFRKYLNQFKAADPRVRKMVHELIRLGERLRDDIAIYL